VPFGAIVLQVATIWAPLMVPSFRRTISGGYHMWAPLKLGSHIWKVFFSDWFMV